MPDVLVIKNGDYCAHIMVEGLPTLPQVKRNAIFRILFEACWENEDTIRTLEQRLPALVEEAKTAWRITSQNDMDGCKIPSDQSSKKEVAAQRRKNARLTIAVKNAKVRYECWTKIETAFNKIKEKEYESKHHHHQ